MQNTVITQHAKAALIRHREQIKETIQFISAYQCRTVNELTSSMELDLKELNQKIEELC